jgi:hypothetical protein
MYHLIYRAAKKAKTKEALVAELERIKQYHSDYDINAKKKGRDFSAVNQLAFQNEEAAKWLVELGADVAELARGAVRGKRHNLVEPYLNKGLTVDDFAYLYALNKNPEQAEKYYALSNNKMETRKVILLGYLEGEHYKQVRQLCIFNDSFVYPSLMFYTNKGYAYDIIEYLNRVKIREAQAIAAGIKSPFNFRNICQEVVNSLVAKGFHNQIEILYDYHVLPKDMGTGSCC